MHILEKMMFKLEIVNELIVHSIIRIMKMHMMT